MARRHIFSGMILAFARAIGEFGATMMVFAWRPGQLTLPISIYNDYEQGEFAHATAAVVALTLISMMLMLSYNRSALGRQE
jgi:molybdate transport system permease protein